MIDDFRESLQRALIRQEWVFDDRNSRIGIPFTWVDGNNRPMEQKLYGVYGLLQYLSMMYEYYKTPKEIEKCLQ